MLGLYFVATSVPFAVGPIIGGHLAESISENGGGFRVVAVLCAACFVINMGVCQTHRVGVGGWGRGVNKGLLLWDLKLFVLLKSLKGGNINKDE